MDVDIVYLVFTYFRYENGYVNVTHTKWRKMFKFYHLIDEQFFAILPQFNMNILFRDFYANFIQKINYRLCCSFDIGVWNLDTKIKQQRVND